MAPSNESLPSHSRLYGCSVNECTHFTWPVNDGAKVCFGGDFFFRGGTFRKLVGEQGLSRLVGNQ